MGQKNCSNVANLSKKLKVYINPFDFTLDKDKLFNITTGEAASSQITEFLLNIEHNGNVAGDESDIMDEESELESEDSVSDDTDSENN
ncbi:unnamed protein product [Brassicogethes aeneus]|uniref:Uncharacterized protein n=1 Tax=Brassicogethes aeneus TaxID=1431903 RepID=A0A9P0B6V2_BRAAE|nr:unnamed protein product [Brassicogethes aeneus]